MKSFIITVLLTLLSIGTFAQLETPDPSIAVSTNCSNPPSPTCPLDSRFLPDPSEPPKHLRVAFHFLNPDPDNDQSTPGPIQLDLEYMDFMNDVFNRVNELLDDMSIQEYSGTSTNCQTLTSNSTSTYICSNNEIDTKIRIVFEEPNQ